MRTILSSSLAAFIAVLGVSGGLAAGGEPAKPGKPAEEPSKPPTLTYTLGQGDSYAFKVEQTGDSRQKTYYLSWVVESRDQDRATVKVTFDRVAMRDAVVKVDFDSAERTHDASLVTFPYACLAKKTVSVVMKTNGEIEELSGFAGFLDEVKAAYKKKKPNPAPRRGACQRSRSRSSTSHKAQTRSDPRASSPYSRR